jgi:hypothetical protein
MDENGQGVIGLTQPGTPSLAVAFTKYSFKTVSYEFSAAVEQVGTDCVSL